MTIKEKPLIDAVSRLEPLPDFLFANPVFAGFFTLLMCAMFGVVTFVFQAAGRGGVAATTVFEAARLGAILGVFVGVLVFAGLAIRAFFAKDEMLNRLLFVSGGVLGAIVLVAVDWLTLETARDWVATAPPIR